MVNIFTCTKGLTGEIGRVYVRLWCFAPVNIVIRVELVREEDRRVEEKIPGRWPEC